MCHVRLVLMLAALNGCAPGALHAERRDGACATRLAVAPPSLSRTPAVQEPESRIAIDLSVDTKRLSQELARRVPVTLAKADRKSIGQAGRVSYTVTRGGFGFSVQNHRLLVSVPIRASVEVCKPLGPFCVTYGRCTPELLSVVSVPLVLERDYGLAKSHVTVQTKRPCRIAGFDATPYVEQAAQRERADIQRQVDAAMVDPRSDVEAAWRLLAVPIALGAAGCLRVEPRQVSQAPPSIAGGLIRTRVVVSGTLAVETPCRSESRPATAPPALEVREQPAGIALELPVRVGWNDASADLSRSLAAATLAGGSGARIRNVKARPALIAGRPRVALGVTLAGATCGDAWFAGEPYYDARSSRIRLRSVVVLAGKPELDRAELSQVLIGAIEQHARVGLVVDVTAAPPALEALVESAGRSLPAGVAPKLELGPARIERVLLDDAGLVPVVSVAGSARLDVAAL